MPDLSPSYFPMRRAFITALTLVAGLTLPAAPAAAQAARTVTDPGDEVLNKAFKALSPEAQTEIADWFTLEVSHLNTFQSQLIQHLLGGLEVDPFMRAEAPELPIYDSSEHTPGQVITRKPLSLKSSKLKSWSTKVYRKIQTRRLTTCWVYDYGSGEVLRTLPLEDPARTFANGLQGLPPWLDLAEALVEQKLDNGKQQKSLAAFGHMYSDRQGVAFPGITLYDAWCSGQEIEMPDVECLGIIHDVLGDWRKWKAPVPETKHDDLYERIQELFESAHRHRGLRHALARTYLIGDAILRDGYQPHLQRFHAMWNDKASDPDKFAKFLPKSRDWQKWIAREGKRVDTSKRRWTAGLNRQATLRNDSARVRETLVWVMSEFGALGGK